MIIFDSFVTDSICFFRLGCGDISLVGNLIVNSFVDGIYVVETVVDEDDGVNENFNPLHSEWVVQEVAH
eukprot:CAMPEP_0172492034 /NCGR_PEP_ID=MMETSP1066-20121228/23010_1 /TAXON_ID=671091 /ORGANISM="Coscinodiscus wailesii, Strain CCMP2513" /LENGTH=68 /DNA_ID=CAMNT_0013261403 /DNA_START=81 /DNA_END=287 /DNA_ORIENTATION=+